MPPFKQVGLRLPEDLHARVLEHQESSGDTLSETLRRLVETGLDRTQLAQQITTLETRQTRTELVLERMHQLLYITARITLDANPAQGPNIEALSAKAKTDLANILVKRFGQ